MLIASAEPIVKSLGPTVPGLAAAEGLNLKFTCGVAPVFTNDPVGAGIVAVGPPPPPGPGGTKVVVVTAVAVTVNLPLPALSMMSLAVVPLKTLQMSLVSSTTCECGTASGDCAIADTGSAMI